MGREIDKMLVELSIKDFAIIDELSITFSNGLNVLSGETGAGKSIIINAVNLILGDRAHSDLIRTGSEEAVVEAMFSLPEKNPIYDFLSQRGVEVGGKELIIRRIVSRAGKNRVFINGSMITLATLSEVGEELINISGQHEHQTLLRPDRHIDIIDEFGKLIPKRMEVARSVGRLKKFIDELNSIKVDETEKARREEFLSFQVKEIDEANLENGEEEGLKSERGVLANAEKLYKNAEEARSNLDTIDGSAQELVGKAVGNLNEIVQIDSEISPLVEALKNALYTIEDAAKELTAYSSKISFDSKRLEEVEERLRLISSLKKKYATSPEAPISDIIAFSEKAKKELLGIEKSDERMGLLEKEIEIERERAFGLSISLSEMRGRVSNVFSKKIVEEVRSLGMGGTTFSVLIGREKAGPDDKLSTGGFLLTGKGIDRLQFLISTNVGEEPRPLAKIASGGELSRILLSMKKTLAETQIIPTLIFDEVDSGIGGGIAQVVGRKLRDVSLHQQVICITHLPQIAGFADTHYSVVKETRQDRTKTKVERLSLDERIMEIARMLGGETITETTLRHAKEMIKSAHNSN